MASANERRLEELTKKLDEILRRLERLEQTLGLLADMGVLPELMSLLAGSSEVYSSRLRMLRRVLAAERALKALPPGDEISKCIIEALAEQGPMNISELTRAVRARRGRASRRVIRARLEDLLKRGLVVEVGGGLGRRFDIRMGTGGQPLATGDQKREER